MKPEGMLNQLVNLYEKHRTEGGTLSPREFLEFWEAANCPRPNNEFSCPVPPTLRGMVKGCPPIATEAEINDEFLEGFAYQRKKPFASPHPSLKVRHETVRPEGEAEDQARYDRTAKTANFCQNCGVDQANRQFDLVRDAHYCGVFCENCHNELFRGTATTPPTAATPTQPCQKCGFVKGGPLIECGDCKRLLCEDCYTGSLAAQCVECREKQREAQQRVT